MNVLACCGRYGTLKVTINIWEGKLKQEAHNKFEASLACRELQASLNYREKKKKKPELKKEPGVGCTRGGTGGWISVSCRPCVHTE